MLDRDCRSGVLLVSIYKGPKIAHVSIIRMYLGPSREGQRKVLDGGSDGGVLVRIVPRLTSRIS